MISGSSQWKTAYTKWFPFGDHGIKRVKFYQISKLSLKQKRPLTYSLPEWICSLALPLEHKHIYLVYLKKVTIGLTKHNQLTSARINYWLPLLHRSLFLPINNPKKINEGLVRLREEKLLVKSGWCKLPRIVSRLIDALQPTTLKVNILWLKTAGNILP